MQKRRFSLGTIAFFTAIGILRGCQEYNLDKQLEMERINQIPKDGISFEEILNPPDNNPEEIEFNHKK